MFAPSPTPDGSGVFVGGRFSKVNGKARHGVVKLRLSDGSVDESFRPNLQRGTVDASALVGNRLYLGGAFASVAQQPRTGFAAVDPTTGALDPNVNVNFGNPEYGALEVTHFAVSPDGRRLVAAGSFRNANGLDRDQIAMLDLTGPQVSVANWETDAFKPVCKEKAGGYIRDLAFAPDSSYFVVATTGGATGVCDSVTRWETGAVGSGQTPTWQDPSGGDSLTQVAVTGTAVYVGGHQRWMENSGAGSGAAGTPCLRWGRCPGWALPRWTRWTACRSRGIRGGSRAETGCTRFW